MNKLAKAFKELCAVCRPRADQNDEGGMEAAARRLFRALGEYPEDVALWALDYWPRHSEFFPTEHELRAVCDKRVGEIAREQAAKSGEPGRGRFLEPMGKTAYFYSRARTIMGDPFCRSWLAGGINCLFSHDTIYTTGTGVERLNRECGGIMQEAGVIAIRHPDASAMLARYCDENNLTFTPRGGRR